MGWGQKARDEVIEDELYAIYRDLNRPHFGPRDLGYPALEEPKELWAEAIRAYMADPNYIKSVAPKTAAAIREAVNANPRLSSHIQFNTRGGAPIGPSDRDER